MLNKTFIVTGGSGNISSAVIKELLSEGANVYALTRKNELDFKHSNLKIIQTEEILNLKNNEESNNKFDGIVFAQGINDKYPVKYLTKDKYQEIFKVNVEYCIELIRTLLKSKQLNIGASIVFISSISSIHFSVSNAAYSASKAALEAYANTLVLELSPQKIRVNIIRPGLLEGKMKDSYALDDSIANFVQKIPLKRLGTAQDISNLVMFLLSDKSSWMTGTTIDIDGGIKFI